MNTSITKVTKFPKGFNSSTSLLDIETQLNNSFTPSISEPINNLGTIRKFIASQMRTAEKMLVRKESKKAMVLKLQKLGHFAEAESLTRCCQNFEALYCPAEKIVYRAVPDYRCGLPICPDCWLTKAGRELHRNLPKFLQAIEEDSHLTLVRVEVSLKTKAGRTQKQGVAEIKRAFKSLRRRTVMRHCAGGIVRIENTVTSEGWHPHIHALLLVTKTISQFELSKNWREITGDSYIVNVNKVDDTAESLIGTFVYPFKPADVTKMNRVQVEEMLGMRGEKLGFSFGEIFGIDAKAPVPVLSDQYSEFLADTKALKVGDPCPSCHSPIVSGRFDRDAYFELLSSARILASNGQPKCRSH